MTPSERIWGANRLVVYQPTAVETLEELDGTREQRIRQKIDQFLDSPESVFDKHPRNTVGQIRHLDTNTRAFATWCQNTTLDVELCIVQEIYQKKNEGDFWENIDEYTKRGSEYVNQFSRMDTSVFDDWKAAFSDRHDLILVD